MSGKYWYHQQIRIAAAAVSDHAFQDKLLHKLKTITGEALPNTTSPVQT